MLDFELLPDYDLLFNQACARGNVAFAQDLIKAGADPANFGFLAVDSAIANNQTASLDFLAKVPGVPEFIYTKYEDMGYKNTLGPHAKTLIQQFLLEKTLN